MYVNLRIRKNHVVLLHSLRYKFLAGNATFARKLSIGTREARGRVEPRVQPRVCESEFQLRARIRLRVSASVKLVNHFHSSARFIAPSCFFLFPFGLSIRLSGSSFSSSLSRIGNRDREADPERENWISRKEGR